VAETLEGQRLDRSKLREAYQEFTSAMIDKTLSYEEKCLSHEGLKITAAALKESGHAGMQVLLASITTTQQALAQPSLKALLRSPEPLED